MARLLAEDLLLLCWDDDKGRPHTPCSQTLAPGVGGALVLDALEAGAIALRGDRVEATDSAPPDPLLAEVQAEVTRRRRPPTLKALVQRVGATRRRDAVRDRLVDAGLLRRDRGRVLGLFPVTRFPSADPAASSAVRAAVRELLTGERDPDRTEAHHVLLAALTLPTKAIDVLVDRAERKQARERATSFAAGSGVPKAVGQAVQEAQAAVTAAITAAVVAGSSSSSSSSS